MNKCLGTPTYIVSRVGLFRDGLRRLLQDTMYDPVYCASSLPSEQLNTILSHPASLVIVSSDIAEATSFLGETRLRNRPYRLVALLDVGLTQRVLEEFSATADALLSATVSVDVLIKSLDLVMAGVSVIPSEFIPLINHNLHQPDSGQSSVASDLAFTRVGAISKRETLVLRRLMEGASNKVIARDLGIAEATVKVHVKAIFRKAGVRNRTQVALWAMQQKIDGEAGKPFGRALPSAPQLGQLITVADGRTILPPGARL